MSGHRTGQKPCQLQYSAGRVAEADDWVEFDAVVRDSALAVPEACTSSTPVEVTRLA